MSEVIPEAYVSHYFAFPLAPPPNDDVLLQARQTGSAPGVLVGADVRQGAHRGQPHGGGRGLFVGRAGGEGAGGAVVVLGADLHQVLTAQNPLPA